MHTEIYADGTFVDFLRHYGYNSTESWRLRCRVDEAMGLVVVSSQSAVFKPLGQNSGHFQEIYFLAPILASSQPTGESGPQSLSGMLA